MGDRFFDFLKFKKNLISIKLLLIGYEEEGLNVFYSPSLDIYGYGDDSDAAIKSFEESMQLYIEHVLEENSFEQDLKKLGWEKHTRYKSRYNPPVYDPREIMSKKNVSSFVIKEHPLELQPA
jgi:hypothetical protein